jgi:ubiquinone/menaquinone biosynthesis C-methylase UbiE
MSDVEKIRNYFGSHEWQRSRGGDRIVAERRALLLEAGRSLDARLSNLRVCDVGCGDGSDLAAWHKAGIPEPQLAGTELMQDRATAALKAAPGADIRTVSGFSLPFGDRSFDICSASLVLSSVRRESYRRALLREMSRVTREGGLVMVYDFTIRKPWNRNVRAINTRQLTRLWRRPDSIRLAAPLLPALELLHRLPEPVQETFVWLLPRTHRLWIWRNG